MFSPLQQYIIKECYEAKGGKVDRKAFVCFYDNAKIKGINPRANSGLFFRSKLRGINPVFAPRLGNVKADAFPFLSPASQIKEHLRVKIITKSLERLIDRGLLVGHGIRTPKKWFIREVKLTAFGRRQWQEWLRRKQKRLPL